MTKEYAKKYRAQNKEYCDKHIKNYTRTKEGVVTKIYANQKSHSKVRGHKPPTYSRNELRDWLFRQPKFHVLYDNWKRLDFQKGYKPSVDRKNDSIGYTMSNIQLMTWRENERKRHLSRKAK